MDFSTKTNIDILKDLIDSWAKTNGPNAQLIGSLIRFFNNSKDLDRANILLQECKSEVSEELANRISKHFNQQIRNNNSQIMHNISGNAF